MGEPVNFEVCCGCTKFLCLEGRFLLRRGVREAAKKRRVKDAVKIQVNTINKWEVAEAMEISLS